MSTSTAILEPGSRWNPAKYEIDDYDFKELTEMFSELHKGCGPNFNAYFGFLRKFVMLSMTNYELDTHVKKFLPTELISVHERFVYRLIQMCDLPVKTRSLDDILNGKEEDDSKDKHYLPHISTLNALAILYSFAHGWKSPDQKFGELLANAVHTMLCDRIDAASHVRNIPVTNEIGVHATFQCSSDGMHSAHSTGNLTATDFLKSFSSKNHFLAEESGRLLKVRCHLNFYTKLKYAVPKEEWDAALEELVLNASILNQKPGGSIDSKSSSQNSVVDRGSSEVGTTSAQKRAGSKRSNSTKGPAAKRKPSEKSHRNKNMNCSASTDVADMSKGGLSTS